MGYSHYANPKKKRDWTQQFGDIASGIGNLAQIINAYKNQQTNQGQLELAKQMQADVLANQERMRQSFQESAMPTVPQLNSSMPPARNNLSNLILQSKQGPPIPPGTGPINPRMDINAFDPGPIKDLQSTASLRGQPLPDILSNVKLQQNQPIPMQSQINTNPALMAKANMPAYQPGATRNIPGWTGPEIESASQNPTTLPALIQARTKTREPNAKLAQNEILLDPMGKEIGRGLPKPNPDEKNQTMENYVVSQIQTGEWTVQEGADFLAKNKGKEFNSSNTMDDYLTTRATEMGQDYSTAKGRQFMLNYAGTPEGRKGFLEWTKQLSEAKPMFSFQTTDQGIVPGNIKTGTVGGPPIGNKPASEETMTQLKTFEQLQTTADALLKRAAKNPSLTGFIQGNWRNIASKVFDDPEFATFKTKINQLVETAYALSGKAISQPEMKMLEGLRGSFSDPDANFQAKMTEFYSWLGEKIKLRQEGLTQTGRGIGEKPAETQKGIVDYKSMTDDQLLKELGK